MTALDRECQQIKKDLMRTLEASSKLENAALVMLDYLEKYPVGLNWHEVVGIINAAVREWQAVEREVKGNE